MDDKDISLDDFILVEDVSEKKNHILKFTEMFKPPDNISMVRWGEPWKDPPKKDPVIFFKSDLEIEKDEEEKFLKDKGKKTKQTSQNEDSLQKKTEEKNVELHDEFFDFDDLFVSKENAKEKSKKKKKKRDVVEKNVPSLKVSDQLGLVQGNNILGRDYMKFPKLPVLNKKKFLWGNINKKKKSENLVQKEHVSPVTEEEFSDDSDDDKDEDGDKSVIQKRRIKRSGRVGPIFNYQRMGMGMMSRNVNLMKNNPNIFYAKLAKGTRGAIISGNSNLIPRGLISRVGLGQQKIITPHLMNVMIAPRSGSTSGINLFSQIRNNNQNIATKISTPNGIMNRNDFLKQQKLKTQILGKKQNILGGPGGPGSSSSSTVKDKKEDVDLKLLDSNKRKVYKTKKVKAKMMIREKEQKAMEENIAESALKANISVKKIEAKTNTISKKRFNPVRNENLCDDNLSWWKEIDWDGKGNTSKSKSNSKLIDYFDTNLIFKKNSKSSKSSKKKSYLLDNEDIEENSIVEKKKEEEFSKRLEKEISYFNLSNDRDYNLSSIQGDTEQTGGRRITRHSVTAENLEEEYFPTNYNHIDISRFHRREVEFPKKKIFKIDHIPPRKPKRRIHKEKIIEKKKDLTSDHHRVIILENIEETPSLINNIGMGTRIVNYFKTGEKNVDSMPDTQDGIVVKLKSRKELPLGLMGKLKDNEYLMSTENDLYSAEIFPKETEGSDGSSGGGSKIDITKKENVDYLLTLKRSQNLLDYKFHIREMPPVYNVGHIQEHVEVPAPGSRKEINFNVLRLEQFVKRKLIGNKSNYVTTKEIKKAFPGMKELKISKKLREFCNAHKTGTAQYWTLKNNYKIDEKELRALVTPEMVCLDESMKRGILQLSNERIDPQISSSCFSLSDSALPNKKHVKIIKEVEKKINKAPWNDTSSFIQIKKGKEEPNLKLIGVARENFSDENLERFQKQAHNEAMQQTEQKLHLTQQEARDLIRSEGRKTEAEIDKMSKQLQRHEANRIRERKTKGATSKKTQKAKAKRTKINEVLFEIFAKESDKIRSNKPYYNNTVDDYNKPEFEMSIFEVDEEQTKKVEENLENDLDKLFNDDSDNSLQNSENESSSGIQSSIGTGDKIKTPGDDLSSQISGRSDLKSVSTNESDSKLNSSSSREKKLPLHMIKKTVRLKLRNGSLSAPTVQYLRKPNEIEAYTKRIEEYKKSTKKKKSKVFIGADKNERFLTNMKEKRRLRDQKRKIVKEMFDVSKKGLKGNRRKKKRKGRRSGYSYAMDNAMGLSRQRFTNGLNLYVDTSIPRKRSVRKKIMTDGSPLDEEQAYELGKKRKRETSLTIVNKKLSEIIIDLMDNPDYYEFLNPISKVLTKEEYIIYKKEIGRNSKPICLRDMKKKCDKLLYNHIVDFLDDIEMLRDNCHDYCEFRHPALVGKVNMLYNEAMRRFDDVKGRLVQIHQVNPTEPRQRPRKRRKRKHKPIQSVPVVKKEKKGRGKSRRGKGKSSGKSKLILTLKGLGTPTPTSNPNPNFDF